MSGQSYITRVKSYFVSTLMGLVATSPAMGKNVEDFFSLSLEELQNIQVTGVSLSKENLNMVPAAVSVFTHQQLHNMGIDSVAEIMLLVPGFQSYRVANSSVAQPYSSRGRRISYNSAEVLVLLDGQRINQANTGGGTSLLPSIPIQNIERVEFIRGPGSAIYGSNAMTGVVNIVTRSGVDNVKVELGSNKNQQVSLQSNYQKGALNTDISLRIFDSRGEDYVVDDPFSDNPLQTSDPFNIGDLHFKLKWNSTQITGHYSQTQTERFFSGGTANNTNQDEANHKYISLKRDFNWQQMESWLWLSHSNYYTVKESIRPISGTSFILDSSTKIENTESRIQWHNKTSFSQYDNFQFGFEYRYVDSPVAKLNINDTSEIEIKAPSTRHISGAYAQYQLTTQAQSQLTLGLRYDEFSDIDSRLSPKLAWVSKINQHHSIKLLYGEAFRAPSEVELNLANTSSLTGNPNLTSETVQSFDVIWFGKWHKFDLALGFFENHFKNTINEIPNENDILQPTNVSSHEHINGIEIESSMALTSSLLAHTSFTLFIDPPELIQEEAQTLFSFNLNYHSGRWNHNLISSYASSRTMINSDESTQKLDSYWLVNLKHRYSFSNGLQAYLKIKNLLDEGYGTPPSFIGPDEGIPNRGREFAVGIDWKF